MIWPVFDLHVVFQHVEVEADMGQLRLGELVDKIELVVRRLGDVLDLVLAIDVDRNEP